MTQIAIFEPREKQNRNGVVYDPAKKQVVFVEDITAIEDEVILIEQCLNYLFAVRGKCFFTSYNNYITYPWIKWIGLGGGNLTAPEAFNQIPLQAGTLKRLKILCNYNDATEGNFVFTIRVNGVDTDLEITIPYGETGIFECEEDVAVEEDDKVAIRIDSETCNSSFNADFNIITEFIAL